MAKSYEEMTKVELQECIKAFRLDAEVAETAKDTKKVTNAEYVTVLNKFKDAQDEAHGVTRDENDNIVEKTPVSKTGSSNKSREQLITGDLERKIPVIVQDYDISQSTDEDLENQMIPIGWGNMLTGGRTSYIAKHGEMQYVQRGALLAMEAIKIPTNAKDANGKETTKRTKKRFGITEVQGWTQAELEAHAKEQSLKKI